MLDPLVPPARTDASSDKETEAARAEMVARLEAAGHLRPGPVRDAFLAVRREVLMPQAYVRRSKPDETPPRWDLLDWGVPADREELLGLLYGGESVLIQHDGEPILGRVPGPRSGGSMTAMSSTVGMTVARLQHLGLCPGQRELDIGTGAGVTAAVACQIAGDAGVVTMDRDEHVTAAARERLAELGHRPTVVTGDGQDGWSPGADYDRIFVSYAVTRVPEAWPQQLAAGGLALATLSTPSPSWPGLAIVTKTTAGRAEARLEAVALGHRAGHGWKQIFLNSRFRERINATDGGSTVTTRTGPPSDEARGMWLALDHLHPGLVRNWAADHLVIGAPDCGSWVTARPGTAATWAVTVCGPRDIWSEIQDTAARWRAAGSPSSYRLHLDPGGTQWVSAGTGPTELSWPLPGASNPATAVPPQATQPSLSPKETSR
ncbi:protein-L-isoaspartate O-methyltransferase family protein [Streptomyces nojiriensis]|uniref:protein-L-isoaspartate O-methyltransferase family protein n=1 Tax=Streptomyces nojiriensis TaxID=66374 RepID=UPI0035E0E9F3